MEIIVTEDQLSLAIGKKGQNVRLATRLVGWNINIVSEELLKKEIALQMSKMIASGEAVPITVLEGVTPNQAEELKGKGITDIESLVATSVDDLVDILDVSLDEAERILGSARAIVEARNAQSEPDNAESDSAGGENSEDASGAQDEETATPEITSNSEDAEENFSSENAEIADAPESDSGNETAAGQSEEKSE